MSGGIAYVLDEQGRFPPLVNREMVDLERPTGEEFDYIRGMIRRHVEYTLSTRGQHVLDNWERLAERFVKVMPKDYKRALAEMKQAVEAASNGNGHSVNNTAADKTATALQGAAHG
jgi:glutamate synthase domain-containing protein 3